MLNFSLLSWLPAWPSETLRLRGQQFNIGIRVTRVGCINVSNSPALLQAESPPAI